MRDFNKKTKVMKTRQMINANGNPWANQIVIENGSATILQSYSSKVVTIESGKVVLGKDWDYSKTTMRAVCAFLSEEYGGFWNKSWIIKAIASGEFTLEERQ